jgi:hypothetical protein
MTEIQHAHMVLSSRPAASTGQLLPQLKVQRSVSPLLTDSSHRWVGQKGVQRVESRHLTRGPSCGLAPSNENQALGSNGIYSKPSNANMYTAPASFQFLQPLARSADIDPPY